MKKIINEISKNNYLSFILGTCIMLGITSTFENSYTGLICFFIIFMIYNLIINLTKKIVPEKVSILVNILIAGTITSIISLLLESYIPSIYEPIKVSLPFMAIVCLIISSTDKDTYKDTLIDDLKRSLIFIISLLIISLVREILGYGSITLMNNISSITSYKSIIVLPASNLFPMSFFTTPAGAFLVYGIFLGIYNVIKGDKNGSN